MQTKRFEPLSRWKLELIRKNCVFLLLNYRVNYCQAAEGIWTPDLLITNQPLHQLSYGGILRPE
jgi:hypothetical protein